MGKDVTEGCLLVIGIPELTLTVAIYARLVPDQASSILSWSRGGLQRGQTGANLIFFINRDKSVVY